MDKVINKMINRPGNAEVVMEHAKRFTTGQDQPGICQHIRQLVLACPSYMPPQCGNAHPVFYVNSFRKYFFEFLRFCHLLKVSDETTHRG